jgi:hypothetical protein
MTDAREPDSQKAASNLSPRNGVASGDWGGAVGRPRGGRLNFDDVQHRLLQLAHEIRAMANSGPYLGFSRADCMSLTSTAELLDNTERACQKARRVIHKRLLKWESRQQVMLSEMLPTFGRLRGPTDQIALIAASRENHRIAHALNERPDQLEEFFLEALRAIAGDLARADPSHAPIEVVASAWGIFMIAKPGLIERYQLLIARVTGSAESPGAAACVVGESGRNERA